MRKLVNFIDIGLVGCEVVLALSVNDDATDEQIDRMASDQAFEWAESYGEIVDDFDITSDDDYENNLINAQDISGDWVDYNGEEHDGYRQGGGSFEDDFR